MTQRLARDLVLAVEDAASRLGTLSEAEASLKTQPGVWSIKEIVGHLIDSAANNHQRFVRAPQLAILEFPGYEQDRWVAVQGYQQRPWLELVDFWVRYNHQLAETIRRVPEASLEVTCRIGAGEPVTLGFLIQDYVAHLRHHLKQIDARRAT